MLINKTKFMVAAVWAKRTPTARRSFRIVGAEKGNANPGTE